MSLSFKVPVKPQQRKPEMKQVVSSVFRQKEKENPRADDPAPKPVKPAPAQRKENDAPKESAFLRMLRRRQMGVAPEKPVPTEDAFNPEVPISGFGERALRAQGLKPGQELGQNGFTDSS